MPKLNATEGLNRILAILGHPPAPPATRALKIVPEAVKDAPAGAITVPEAIERFSIKKRTIYGWISSGGVTATKYQGKIFVMEKETADRVAKYVRHNVKRKRRA